MAGSFMPTFQARCTVLKTPQEIFRFQQTVKRNKQPRYRAKTSGHLDNCGRSVATAVDVSLPEAASASATVASSAASGCCCLAPSWWDRSVQRTRSATTPDQETGRGSVATDLHPANARSPLALYTTAVLQRHWQCSLLSNFSLCDTS